MKKSDNKGILVFIMNPNGWRNPNVYGGGEIQTLRLINRMSFFEWYIIAPYNLKKLINIEVPAANLFFIELLFKKTNVILDVIQGLYVLLKSILLCLISRKNYSVIYSSTTNFSDLFPAKLASLLFNKPLIVKYHISLYTDKDILSIFKNYKKEQIGFLDALIRSFFAWISLIILNTSKVIVVSDSLREQLINSGVKPRNVYVNYNGIDFGSLESKKKLVNKEYDFIFMGRIEKSKGILDLIEAIHILAKGDHFTKTVIVGDGSALSDVRSLISKLGLNDYIEITGFLGEERYDYLQKSRIFVSPSYANEGFGLSVLEALYFLLPTVLYYHPVFEEVFGRFKGVYFSERSPNSLAKTLLSILSTYETPEKSQLQVYSLEHSAQRELDLLKASFDF